MSDKKPSVIPTQEQKDEAQAKMSTEDMIAAANDTGDLIANQFTQENQVFQDEVSMTESVAAEMMAEKTAQQIAERERVLQIQKDRAAQLDIERAKVLNQKAPVKQRIEPPINPPENPPTDTPAMMDQPENPKEVDKYASISQPQTDASFDVIPVPSEGKVYKGKKKSFKVAHLNASDENILSNPNLMESGQFLEILINRKLLETDIRYKDLHVGDVNAILIWLRATAYGPEYTITVYDPETTEPFDHTIDLSTLKIKNLKAEPDKEGYFDFTLPNCGKPVKFKLLTVGEVNLIEDHIRQITDTLGPEFVDMVTFVLTTQLVEVDGNRDEGYISDFVNKMMISDSRALRKYMDEIESGVDLELDIETPGGGSLNMFLPFNFEFYWPKL